MKDDYKIFLNTKNWNFYGLKKDVEFNTGTKK